MKRHNGPDLVVADDNGNIFIADLKSFAPSNTNRIFGWRTQQRQVNGYVKLMERISGRQVVQQLSLFDLDEYPQTPINFADNRHAIPTNIDWLLRILMTKHEREALIGDLDERYAAMEQSAGRRAATRWFWCEVTHTFLSLALDALKRVSGLDKLYRQIGS